jgi:hypothetical protein
MSVHENSLISHFRKIGSSDLITEMFCISTLTAIIVLATLTAFYVDIINANTGAKIIYVSSCAFFIISLYKKIEVNKRKRSHKSE